MFPEWFIAAKSWLGRHLFSIIFGIIMVFAISIFCEKYNKGKDEKQKRVGLIGYLASLAVIAIYVLMRIGISHGLALWPELFIALLLMTLVVILGFRILKPLSWYADPIENERRHRWWRIVSYIGVLASIPVIIFSSWGVVTLISFVLVGDLYQSSISR